MLNQCLLFKTKRFCRFDAIVFVVLINLGGDVVFWVGSDDGAVASSSFLFCRISSDPLIDSSISRMSLDGDLDFNDNKGFWNHKSLVSSFLITKLVKQTMERKTLGVNFSSMFLIQQNKKRIS